MRRIEFSDEFSFSDGKPIRSPQDLGDRLTAEPGLEAEAWLRVDDGSLERWLHDTGWEEPARQVAQMRKQKTGRTLVDLVRPLQGKAPSPAPRAADAQPAKAEPALPQAKTEPAAAVSVAPVAAEPPAMLPVGESGLLERQRQAIRVFRDAEAALRAVSDEEGQRVRAEEEEAREEAEARRADAEGLWHEAQSFQARAAQQTQSVNLDLASLAEVGESASQAGSQVKRSGGAARIGTVLPYLLIGGLALVAGGTGILYGYHYLMSAPSASSPTATQSGVQIAGAPVAPTLRETGESAGVTPKPPSAPEYDTVVVNALRERAKTAQELWDTGRHKEALALLKKIQGTDRALLGRHGIDVASMEERILREHNQRTQEEERLTQERLTETRLQEQLRLLSTARAEGELAKALDLCNQIKKDFPSGMLAKCSVDIETEIVGLETQQREVRLRQQVGQVTTLRESGKLAEAIERCKQIQAEFPAGQVAKHIDIETTIRELETRSAEEKLWERGFGYPVVVGPPKDTKTPADNSNAWRRTQAFAALNVENRGVQWQGFHPGEDWTPPEGRALKEPVRAVAMGVVFKVYSLRSNSGCLIAVLHTAPAGAAFKAPNNETLQKVYSIYENVAPAEGIREGRVVKGGESIGHLVVLPYPNSPHLHFEIRHPCSEGLWSEDGSMVYTEVAKAQPAAPSPGGGSRPAPSTGGLPKTSKKHDGWDIAKEILKGLAEQNKASAKGPPPPPPPSGRPDANWVRLPYIGNPAGYYRDLQQMIKDGLLDPSEFIKANPVGR